MLATTSGSSSRGVAVGRGPLAKRQIESVELTSDVANQTGRRQIEHAQAWILRKQLLNEQAGLDRFPKADFIGNQHALE